MGARGIVQQRHGILRNYPILGYAWHLTEKIRPEIKQYFVESGTESWQDDWELADAGTFGARVANRPKGF